MMNNINNSSVLAMHPIHYGFSSHMESQAALDLCVRKRPLSPESLSSDYNHYRASKRMFGETPTLGSTSPGSHHGSETGSETSMSSDPMREYSSYPTSTTIQKIKPARPFKAYPKDPLSLVLGVTNSDGILGKDSADAYSEFRQKMLAQVQAHHNGTNKNMRRMSQNAQSMQNEDPTYWEKRKKNNEAAKRSRDARRAKEDEIAIRCAFLEQENIKLKYRIAAMENERERLQNIYH